MRLSMFVAGLLGPDAVKLAELLRFVVGPDDEDKDLVVARHQVVSQASAVFVVFEEYFLADYLYLDRLVLV